jgi:hypothetical protein
VIGIGLTDLFLVIGRAEPQPSQTAGDNKRKPARPYRDGRAANCRRPAGYGTRKLQYCDGSVEGNKTGSITQAQSQSAVKNFSSADTNRDGKLSKEEFTEACRKGLVTPKK